MTPLRAAKLVAWLVVGTWKDARSAVLIFQDNGQLRAGFCCLENRRIAVALGVQDEGFEFFVDLEDIRRD